MKRFLLENIKRFRNADGSIYDDEIIRQKMFITSYHQLPTPTITTNTEAPVLIKALFASVTIHKENIMSNLSKRVYFKQPRAKGVQPLDHAILSRVSRDEKLQIKTMAQAHGTSASTYIREKVLGIR